MYWPRGPAADLSIAIQLGRDAREILTDCIRKKRLRGTSTAKDIEKVDAVDIVTQSDNST